MSEDINYPCTTILSTNKTELKIKLEINRVLQRNQSAWHGFCKINIFGTTKSFSFIDNYLLNGHERLMRTLHVIFTVSFWNRFYFQNICPMLCCSLPRKNNCRLYFCCCSYSTWMILCMPFCSKISIKKYTNEAMIKHWKL